MFIAFLYMFRTTMCPSSRENTLPMRHLIFVTLYRWLSGMQGGISVLHTRQSSTQSEKYQLSHRYGIFSWWWENSCPKHVEKNNKHIKQICASRWFCLQKINFSVLVYIFWYYYFVYSNNSRSIGHVEQIRKFSKFNTIILWGMCRTWVIKL